MSFKSDALGSLDCRIRRAVSPAERATGRLVQIDTSRARNTTLRTIQGCGTIKSRRGGLMMELYRDDRLAASPLGYDLTPRTNSTSRRIAWTRTPYQIVAKTC